MDKNRLKIQIILISFLVSIVLMAIKFVAYFITHSNSVLTDALESIINVVATGFALYSLKLAAKPRDFDHPYGHGKIEFFASGFEGGLIIVAGLLILYKSILFILNPVEIHQIDYGIYLISFTAFINLVLGLVLIKKGKEYKTEVLIADGRHLITDTVSTLGIVVGLVLIYFTKITVIDSYVSLLMAFYIIYNGYKTMRPAVAGLMDETDPILLEKIKNTLIKHRTPLIIDVHNLRIVKYGSELHIDCHVTLPFYSSLVESHDEIKRIEDFLKNECDQNLEIFIHVDPCLPDLSCKICLNKTCTERKHPFEKEVEWNMNTLMTNQKHRQDVVD